MLTRFKFTFKFKTCKTFETTAVQYKDVEEGISIKIY